MDAKAVADRIYKEHSLSVTEEEVLDAQAWLQEERKINETPPATEKTDENTTQNSLPTAGGETAEKVEDTAAPAPSEVPASSAPTPNDTPANSAQPLKVEIPADIHPVPIATIDGLIRRGYTSRDDICDIMKHNFKGKAYRKEVIERLKLYEARQSPFDNMPAPKPPVAGEKPSTNLRTAGAEGTDTAGVNTQNTGISRAPGTLPNGLPASYQRATRRVPAGY
jgi:hypothetical protein